MRVRGFHRSISRVSALVLALLMMLPTSLLAAPSSDTSGSIPSTSTPAGTRTPPADDSPIDVGTDAKTEGFRAELAAKQARLDEFTAQLDALDRELEVASEQYNAAVERLDQMNGRVRVAEDDLEKARSAYQTQSELLGDRASAIYKDGSFAAVDIILASKSVSDFVERVKFLNTIGIRDADIAESLQSQKDALESQLVDLERSKEVAQSLEFELKARQIEIMLRIQERQQMLAQAQSDLLELLDSQAANRQAEEAKLLAEILAGINKQGITVAKGSPVETALAYHGVPYLWGGETPSGFDCSGLVLYVFRQHGVNLPHYSGSQFLLGEKVAPASLQPGDVVFFGSPIHHVGIYIGGGYFIHAPRTGDFVKISKLSGRKDYAGARRYDWVPRTAEPVGAVKSVSEALGNTSR